MAQPNPHKVLVTGAAGFIAYHLIDSLLRRGIAVEGIDNFDPYYDVALKEENVADLKELARKQGTEFRFHSLDITDPSTFSAVGEGVRAVVHLAAKVGVRASISDPEGYVRNNVLGTLNMLQFCRDRGVAQIVLGSTSSAYGIDSPPPFSENAQANAPISPYAATKKSAELLCHTYAHLYGLRVAALRFFTVYGPRQRPDLAFSTFVRLIEAGEPIQVFGDGLSTRDYTFVTDIVSGIEGALEWSKNAPERSFEVFNLGGGSRNSLREVIRIIESALGTKAKLLEKPMQPGDMRDTHADLSKSERILKYKPTFDLSRGIEEFVSWHRGRWTKLKAVV